MSRRGDEHLVRFGPNSDYSAPNLKAVLTDPERLKLYHFARCDLAGWAEVDIFAHV